VRGSPLFRAVCAAIVLLVAALPIARLTHRRATAAAELASAERKSRPEEAAVPVQIRFEFTSPPQSVRLFQEGRELALIETPGTEVVRRIPLVWVNEGVDLRVQVAWPESRNLSAARVTVTDANGAEYQRSMWGSGPTDEVLIFP